MFLFRAKTWTSNLPKPFLANSANSGMIASPSTNKLSALFPNVQDSGSGQGDAIPQPVVFVEDLSDRLANDFPDLWKLGQVKLTVYQIF